MSDCIQIICHSCCIVKHLTSVIVRSWYMEHWTNLLPEAFLSDFPQLFPGPHWSKYHRTLAYKVVLFLQWMYTKISIWRRTRTEILLEPEWESSRICNSSYSSVSPQQSRAKTGSFVLLRTKPAIRLQCFMIHYIFFCIGHHQHHWDTSTDCPQHS